MAKTTSSVASALDDTERPAFGSRFLTAEADVWSHSAWDHVPPPDDQEEIINKSLNRQRLNPVPEHSKDKYNARPSKFWNNFYANNANNFFKDRKWLFLEFTDLVEAIKPDVGEKTILEVGCGAGNAAFPLLSANQNPNLRLFACDYAPKAVEVVQANPLYKDPPLGEIKSSVWDLASRTSLPEGILPNSVDIIILIFVLSALSPREWQSAMNNIYTMLKPGGVVLLRDYGRHDLTQLRFKDGRLLDDNFYIRGDGTRVYFFEVDELARLFTGSSPSVDQVTITESSEDVGGAEERSNMAPPLAVATPPLASEPPPSAIHTPSTPSPNSPVETEPSANDANQIVSTQPQLPPHPLFTIKQLGVDRRLLVNRKRQLKMYRVWMQGQFRKIDPSSESGDTPID